MRDPKAAHSPKENADLRRKRRFSTSFRASRNPVGLRANAACVVVQPDGIWTPAFAGVTEAGVTQESSRALDPCFRRGNGGGGHTGILQACRRTRERHFLTSFLRKQDSSGLLAPCFRVRRRQGSHRNPVGLWTPACAGVTGAGVTQESCGPVGARGNGIF